MMQMVDQFFDRAMYYAVRGHEQVRGARWTAEAEEVKGGQGTSVYSDKREV